MWQSYKTSKTDFENDNQERDTKLSLDLLQKIVILCLDLLQILIVLSLDLLQKFLILCLDLLQKVLLKHRQSIIFKKTLFKAFFQDKSKI